MCLSFLQRVASLHSVLGTECGGRALPLGFSFGANTLYCFHIQPKLTLTFTLRFLSFLFILLPAEGLQAKESLLQLAVCLRWPTLSRYLLHQTRGPTRWSSPGQEGDAPLRPAQKDPLRFLLPRFWDYFRGMITLSRENLSAETKKHACDVTHDSVG